MKLGIVGLPNVGKSTLFNAITNAGAQVANYAFCTIDPNVGVVSVPDARLDRLTELFKPQKRVPATIDFVDIAGLVRGASRGEGLGNKFLANIREVDAIVHVVRCFEDGEVSHVDGTPDPLRDMETINLELIFSDLEYLERRIEKTEKLSKGGNKTWLAALDFYRRLQQHLLAGLPARTFATGQSDEPFLADLFLLTRKPVLYVGNISEADIGRETDALRAMREAVAQEDAQVIGISAQIEADLTEMEAADQALFLAELGLQESGLSQIIRAGYRLLGLISFFTVGEDEVRAWTISRGTKAPQAAGKIHTDFERGFIRAEVVTYDDLIAHGSLAQARDKGLIRSEGKTYEMQDGDVVVFRFNV